MRTRLATFLCFVALAVCRLPLHAQAASGWDRVMQLPARQAIRVRMTGQTRECLFQAATPDSLTCTRERTVFFFVKRSSAMTVARADILTVKLARRALSTWTGVGIGVATSIAVGAGSGNTLAAVAGAPLTAAVGATIGGATDFLAHPTIYQAP